MHQKGTFSKIKGNFSNIPIEAAFICNILNMSTVFNRSVVVKLKKNFKYMGHLYFEWSCQDIIYDVLAYLKIHNISIENKLPCQYLLRFSDIVKIQGENKTAIEKIISDRTEISESINDTEIEYASVEDPQGTQRAASTALISEISNIFNEENEVHSQQEQLKIILKEPLTGYCK